MSRRHFFPLVYQKNRGKIIIWKKQQNLYQSANRSWMSLNPLRNRQPSFQQSRVSSSSSSSSQAYELIPREQPFFNPVRDIASPRASFPFRRVQSGNESAMGNRSINESRGSMKGYVKDANQSKEIAEANEQFNLSSKESERQRQALKKSALHDECLLKIREANKKIEELQKRLEEERQSFQLERKANEIYTEGFTKIRQLILARSKHLQGQSMQQMVKKLEQMLQSKPKVDANNAHSIIEEQDKKIRQLRAELLKSTQNNINAIFNTEITEACLLQSQIQKMNQEIINLKQKLIKVTEQNQQNIAKMIQSNANSPQAKKIIKYYNLNFDSESDGQSIGKDIIKRRKQAKQSKLRQSRQRPTSQKSYRKLAITQNKINDMIQDYRILKEDYKRLATCLTQINSSQSDFKQSFSTLAKSITLTIKNEIHTIKQSVNRPSSNHQQLRIAKELQIKLNDLINTLNAPQKVNIEKDLDDE